MSNTQKRILLLIAFGLFLLVVCLISGCASNEETVTLQLTNDVVFKSTIKRVSLLHWTRASAITHNTPFTTTTIGNIETAPDPNSVNAFSEGVTEAFLKAMGLL